VATETVKIVRMQQRRGQKQDLPKPLRPGEIGFATDSRQIYIGADTSDIVSDGYNKTASFEKTSSSQSTTASVANVQIIKFTVPHKIYDKGEFDGVTDSIVWTPDSNVAVTSTDKQYSRLNKVYHEDDTQFLNIFTLEKFISSDLKAVQNGKVLSPSQNGAGEIGSSNDYHFAQTGNITLQNHSHTLRFRTAPSGSEEIAVSYYSNTDVISSFTDTKIGDTTVDGFYNAKSIATYRQLNANNVSVAEGTGIGFIGLQYKHIQVATDVLHTPNVSDYGTTLGNVLLSKNEDAVAGLTAVTTTADVTMTGAIPDPSYGVSITGNVNSVINHVYVTGGADWLNEKVLEVKTYDAGNGILAAYLPSNASSITRSITAIVDSGSGTIKLTSQSNVDDTASGDTIRFLEEGGGNVSQLDAIVGTVTDVNTASKQITVDTAIGGLDTTLANTLTFMTMKAGDVRDLVVYSPRHGNSNGNMITLSSGALAGNYSVAVGTSADTFVITTLIDQTSNVSSALTVTPVVSNATVSATPVIAFNLATATDTSAVLALINGTNKWPKIATIPGSANKMYITHAEAIQKTPFTFKLFDDVVGTVSLLGLTPGEYSRENATVKAKLEEWMYSIYGAQDPSINLFKEIYSNNEFSAGAQKFANWDLGINSAIGEMNFESRTEVKDFTRILNDLYFESVNPDIRGLLNIKTNIEFLTTEALAAGTATTQFTSPEQLVFATGSQPVTEFDLPLSGDFKTVFVEYSMFGGTGADRYRRVGTLSYSADTDALDVIIQDNYSDMVSGSMTGSVSFTAEVPASAVDAQITLHNSLTPVSSLTMRYVVRKWGD